MTKVPYASLYTLDGAELTVGLRTSQYCDEAIHAARRMAASRGEAIHLIDDDGEWIVNPDGSCEEHIDTDGPYE